MRLEVQFYAPGEVCFKHAVEAAQKGEEVTAEADDFSEHKGLCNVCYPRCSFCDMAFGEAIEHPTGKPWCGCEGGK